MVKESWGIKRTCPCGNGVRFYDLNKKEIECPSCGENINVEQLSISTLENNLRKKPQAQIIESNKEVNKKKVGKDKDTSNDKDTIIEEDDSGANPKIEAEEIIGDKIKKPEEKES